MTVEKIVSCISEFCGWNKLSIFNWLSEKISASMSHFLRLKILFLENYFCDFSTRFSFLGLAEFVEKNMASCSKRVAWIYSCFTSWKVNLVLRLHIFRKFTWFYFHKFFLFKQVSTLILFIGFHNKNLSVQELPFLERKPVQKYVMHWAFKVGILGTHYTLH